MRRTKPDKNFKNLIAPQISVKEELHQYEESFRRWLTREIHSGRYTMKQAMNDLKMSSPALRYILKMYQPGVAVTLPPMTEAEKIALQKLQQRIKELEKQLQDAEIKNITLETMVDVAEKQFKLPIRKKPGAKQ